MYGSQFCNTHPDGQVRMIKLGVPPEERRCAFDGCRKWTVRGLRYCGAHPDGHPVRMSIGQAAEHRRCAFVGCRKWNVRGSRFCATHADGERKPAVRPAEGNRRCRFAGCRMWTVRGSRFCRAHPDGQPSEFNGGLPPEDRRCTFQGCKKWRMSGADLCNTHIDGGRTELAGASRAASWRDPMYGQYVPYVPMDGLEEALSNASLDDLRVEIAITRDMMRHALTAGLPLLERIDVLAKLSRVLVRLFTIQKRLCKDGPAETEREIEQWIRELGLGDEDQAQDAPAGASISSG
jgi:hypothetical protein